MTPKNQDCICGISEKVVKKVITSSEIERLKLKGKIDGAIEPVDSAARVVFNYFRARKSYSQIVQKFDELVKIADIVDSAKFTKTDIMNPQGWTMLAFITDPHSNFGKKHTFTISIGPMYDPLQAVKFNV